jgi:predicted NBD/HSP70 family sugar kinase
MTETRGGDRSGLRQYNERLIVQAIRRTGGLPKAEIARQTGLSPQTISVVVNRMLDDGLLVKSDKLRGRVGQPSTMIQLNPRAARSIGVKIGRRNLDILLMDLTGGIIGRVRRGYPYPLPAPVLQEVEHGIAALCGPEDDMGRLLGVGLCLPTDLDRWPEEMAAPPEKLAEWRGCDLRGQVAAMTGLPVMLTNDVAAAASAEIAFGKAIDADTCLYLYLGAFVGGALVLSGRILPGPLGNACAIGSLPLSGFNEVWAGRQPEQLLRRASLIVLGRELARAGSSTDALSDFAAVPAQAAAVYDTWRRVASAALAYAIVCAVSVIRLDQVVIDGSLPRPLLGAMVADTEAALDRCNFAGLSRPALAQGSLGGDARVLGAGLLPINANFSPDRNLLLKASLEAA